MLWLVALASGVFAAAPEGDRTPVQVVLATQAGEAGAVVLCRTGRLYETPAILAVVSGSFTVKSGRCAGSFTISDGQIEWRRGSNKQRLQSVCRPRLVANLAVEGWHSSLRTDRLSGGDSGHELIVRFEDENGVSDDLENARSFFAAAGCRERKDDGVPARGEDGSIRVKYLNCSYGYTANLPQGVVGYGTVAPNPDHGFRIDLANPAAPPPEDPARYFFMDASYDALEWRTAQSAISAEAARLMEEHPDVDIDDRISFQGRAFFARMSAAYGDRVEERAIAIKRGVVFTAGLSTTSGNVEADHFFFEKMLRGLDLSPAGLDCSGEE